MSASATLWSFFAANVVLYIVIGRVLVGQPRWNYPTIFQVESVATAAAWAPVVGFIILIIAGFIWHTSPWWFLAVNVGAFVAFSVRPGR